MPNTGNAAQVLIGDLPRSIVEQLGFNLLPAAMLSLLTAALMVMGLGPRRRRGINTEA